MQWASVAAVCRSIDAAGLCSLEYHVIRAWLNCYRSAILFPLPPYSHCSWTHNDVLSDKILGLLLTLAFVSINHTPRSEHTPGFSRISDCEPSPAMVGKLQPLSIRHKALEKFTGLSKGVHLWEQMKERAGEAQGFDVWGRG